MSDWQKISTAPKDGTIIELGRGRGEKKEIYGLGLWGIRSKNAPTRKPLFDPITGDCINGTQAERDKYADIPAWIQADKMYLIPRPSHWRTPKK